MIYVKVNGALYPATIDGQMQDYTWDNRESKTITMQGTYDEIVGLFKDGTPWSIVMKETVQKRNEDGSPVLDEAGNPVTEEQTSEWDNSEFSMSGPITDNRDGTVSIKMGKPTDLEDAMELLLGGETA
ncbi:hypothetical protein LI148_07460 [Colidextribacter sp. 210702-DFI.3.9]|nr:hypothetical protein [Colidextribacter sp. 210702-DFI.3.9]